jgi:hypothetical protein
MAETITHAIAGLMAIPVGGHHTARLLFRTSPMIAATIGVDASVPSRGGVRRRILIAFGIRSFLSTPHKGKANDERKEMNRRWHGWAS